MTKQSIDTSNSFIKSSHDVIHCVYAGTFDPIKGGALTSAMIAEYLPSNYHIHILGFGTEKQVSDIIDQIEIINSKSMATLTYDGMLTGESFNRFISSSGFRCSLA